VDSVLGVGIIGWNQACRSKPLAYVEARKFSRQKALAAKGAKEKRKDAKNKERNEAHRSAGTVKIEFATTSFLCVLSFPFAPLR
jgi:hypothetical protein